MQVKIRKVTMAKPQKTTSKTKQTRWVAERRLERRDAVGGIVVVRIGCPELPPGDNVWRCPFVILGLGDDSILFGKSDESMAALQNAIDGIHYKLEQSGIPVRWEGFDEDVTGFSMRVPWTYGRAFQQRLEKKILSEEEELVRPLRERHERREARRKARAKPQPK
ncbi:hypothetical protein [Polyangium sp. 15x6]|uniref:DUF6968 family protein n=1 Tax=Polyangium sp. 15x6 TaxID=3042687 RepID=UPI00249A357E|nr:hypothetical protein [Polyangium sp. 15x6]MDI3282655.1 hypothetical protein [Polyangium sp. 15x6]